MKKSIALLLSLVMILGVSIISGVNFTSYATTIVTEAGVTGIDTPLPGRPLDLDAETIGAGYEIYNENPVVWYDLSSNNPYKPVANDAKYIEGHRYNVLIKLRNKIGYEFATKNDYSTVNLTVNSQEAAYVRYGSQSPKNIICISYTFPECKKEKIPSVTVQTKEDIQYGTELSGDTAIVSEKTVSGILPAWTHDGVGVAYGTKVEYGHYGVLLTMAADTGYTFSNYTKIKLNGTALSIYWMSNNGSIVMAKTADDFFDVPCGHETNPSLFSGEWSKDATTHWHECTVCGEKKDIDAHTFGAGTLVDGKTTYTCTTCGYKKIQAGTESGFLYANCDGGVQIYGYTGSETNIHVPSSIEEKEVVSIGDFAFANKADIKSIKIPSTVKSIGKGAFNKCTGLEYINIPEGIKRIESETFSFCSSLENIDIPYGVSYIGGTAFGYCSSLKEIIIPCGVKEIKNTAFRACTSLKNVVIPDSVTTLGESAFISCSGLETVVVGNGLTTINQSVFDVCTNLTTVTIPATITTISNYAFEGCPNLQKVNYRGTEEQWNNIKIVSIDNHNQKLAEAQKTYNYTEKIDVGQHHFKTITTIEPTCVEQGYTLHVCSGCGDSYQDNIVPATGVHTYDSGIISKDATCLADGEKTFTCTTCGDTRKESIAKLEHKFTTVITKATLKKDGSIVEKCTEDGNVKSTTAIPYPKTIAISKSAFVYNKKAQKPTVTVKDSKGKVLKEGTDYTVSYSNKNSKKVGKYTVKVVFKGNYEGEKTFTYTIKPKGTSLKKLTKGKKQFKVTWNKQKTETTGYEVQYSTNKNFKSGNKKVNIKKNKTTSTTVKKLKKNKKYYVRIRTYKTVKVNNKNIKLYSSWSSTKNVKTK